MANARVIKRRIKSAKNIAQITKAMELVAASKMKKAQIKALSGRLYAQKIYDMVMRLSVKADASNHPYLLKPAVVTGKKLIICVTTNKGLCGGLNTNFFRYLLRAHQSAQGLSYITVGKKGASFIASLKRPLVADFSDMVPFTSAVGSIVTLITDEFLKGSYDSIEIIYNDFISISRQEPKRKKLLPLTLDEIPESHSAVSLREEAKDILIEPDVRKVFHALLPHYVENQIRDAILQAEASEHSARMVAMRNATDNAVALTDALTLVYNKARQEKITYEITDMVTARLAVAQ